MLKMIFVLNWCYLNNLNWTYYHFNPSWKPFNLTHKLQFASWFLLQPLYITITPGSAIETNLFLDSFYSLIPSKEAGRHDGEIVHCYIFWGEMVSKGLSLNFLRIKILFVHLIYFIFLLLSCVGFSVGLGFGPVGELLRVNELLPTGW